ncbi:MAG: hypothetical protein MR387_05950, partial [Phocaeicola plebeius]|nr:hypothetical protein [Phocaeicola plebeius]
RAQRLGEIGQLMLRKLRKQYIQYFLHVKLFICFYKFLLKLFFAMIQEAQHHVRHPSVHDGTETTLDQHVETLLVSLK